MVACQWNCGRAVSKHSLTIASSPCVFTPQKALNNGKVLEYVDVPDHRRLVPRSKRITVIRVSNSPATASPGLGGVLCP